MITGAARNIDEQEHLVFTRTFRAPIEDVWASVTESERLARWFGTWEGDSSTGRVEVQMIFEGDAPAEPYVIEVCEAPHRLRVHTDSPEGEDVWTLDLRLSHANGVTTLEFAQVLTDRSLVLHVGPGWEYYLDRLEAAIRTGAVATTAWDGYMAKSAEYAVAFDLLDPDLTVLITALDQLTALIRAGDDTPDAPTPCTGWTVRDLSAHLVTTTERFARSMRGEDVDWAAPPQPIEDDPEGAFARAAADLQHARVEAEAPDAPDFQLAEYAVHTWDLATALGRSTTKLDQEVAERGGTFMRANLTDQLRGSSFAPAVEPAADADAYGRIAAFAGRRP